MTNDLNYMTTGTCGRDGCACTGSGSSTGGGTSSGGSDSDDDGGSDSTMSVYTTHTIEDLAEASGIATEKLTAMDDSELEALAESLFGNDDGDDGDGDSDGGGDDEPIELDELSEAVREKLVAVVAKAREAGVDLSEFGLDELFDLDDLPEGEAAAAAALAANGGSNTGSGGVTYTSNTKKVAQAHGLPMDWAALDGIPAPPSLADVPMSDEGLAAWINKAHGVEGPGDRVVTASLIGNVRDKGVERGPTGVQVEDLAANDAGLDNNLDEEHPLPAKTVTNRVEAHMARTGQTNSRDAPSSGLSLEDLDGGA